MKIPPAIGRDLDIIIEKNSQKLKLLRQDYLDGHI